MEKRLYVLVLIFLVTIGYAQGEANTWYFGGYSGLDFNNGLQELPARLDNGTIDYNWGISSSMSDSQGRLLFYTNGINIYTKAHTIMQNGEGISDGAYGGWALIVPKPESSTQYFIFYRIRTAYWTSTLGYSIIDMSLNNGLGAVVQGNVAVTNLADETCSYITGVHHANGTDIWIFVRKKSYNAHNTDAIYSYLLTNSGLQQPVVTPLDNNFNEWEGISIAYTKLKAAPSGKYIGVATAGDGIDNYSESLRVYELDNTNGTINTNALFTDDKDIESIEFSSSGEVFYAGDVSDDTMSGRIFQYDLTSSNIQPLLVFNRPAWDMQLGPDGKIYVATGFRLPPFSSGDIPQPSRDYMHVIDNPNVVGIGCNAVYNKIFLPSYRNADRTNITQVLPSYLYLKKILYIKNCPYSAINFFVNVPYVPDSITWSFDDGTTVNGLTAEHIYPDTGVYPVTATVRQGATVDVITQNVVVIPPMMATKPPDMYVCVEDGSEEVFLDLDDYTTIILGSQTTSNFEVTYHNTESDANEGIYKIVGNVPYTPEGREIFARVRNANSFCYGITSFKLYTVKPPQIAMQDFYSICNNNSVTVTAPLGFDSYLWSSGQTTPQVILGPGIYTLSVSKNYPGTVCTAHKTITVFGSETPIVSNVITQDFTDNDNSITVVTGNTQPMLYSIDGINYQQNNLFTGLEPGFYTVYVKDPYDCGLVKKEVELLMFPRFFTPNGDGYNDTWRIKYSVKEPGMQVRIYDRYGKFLGSFKGNSEGWTGMYAGKPLPATDYWFVAEREDGRILKGHFSLLR